MPRGNPAAKLAMTIDADVHKGVVAAAEAERVSVSAWMTNAARRELLIRDGLAAVAEWEAENGALSADEMAAARRRMAERRTVKPDTVSGNPRTSSHAQKADVTPRRVGTARARTRRADA